MKRVIEGLRGLRVWALILKELRHIKRNSQLIASLVIPPTVQLVVLGLALNPAVRICGLALWTKVEPASAATWFQLLPKADRF